MSFPLTPFWEETVSKAELEQVLFFGVCGKREGLGLGIRDLESKDVRSRKQGFENVELQIPV